MFRHWYIISIVLLAYFMSFAKCSKRCYAHELSPYKFFASKTAYDEIRGYTVREVDYPGCTPVQFYFIARHGTRYPKLEVLKKMRDRLPLIRDAVIMSATKKRGMLCQSDLNNLKAWHNHLSEDLAEKLAPNGESEMKSTGMRFKIRFPNLLQPPKQRKGIDVRVIDHERVKLSAKYFMNGLWGDDSRLPYPIEDNQMLRFYDTCRLWKNTVAWNHRALFEVMKFNNGPKMEILTHDVTARMGLKWRLSFNDVLLMYDACRFEAAWDEDSVSPWCAAFTQQELMLLEYSEDLKFYYKHGYGHQINYIQACPPVKDIVERLGSKAIYNRSEPTILLRFGTSGMFIKLLARLGMFKDKMPPLATNFRGQDARAWRTSRIIPFASNLAFTLLDCKYDQRVATFFQEREIPFPHCTTRPCPLTEFLYKLERIAEECDVDKICMS